MDASIDDPLSLEAVICTDLLQKRPSRPPDYEAESRALATLSQALADSPQTILQTLVEVALGVLRAGSAGISLLCDDNDGQSFYWPAIAGDWSNHTGGGLPRDCGPCGAVLDRGAAQLFARPQQHYRELAPLEVPITEALFIPLSCRGKAVGTIWVLAHDEHRQFDAEDLRLLGNLARFAAGAYRVLQPIHAADVAAASEANAKFRTFFEQGSYFAGVMTLDGTIVEANRLCLDACGFTRDEVIGRKFWDCGWWNRSPELIEMVREGTRQAARGEPFRTESPYFLADGSQRIVDLIIAPVKDDAGRVLFIAPTGTDVTERKRSEEALRDADRRKDEFLATLAHELRNPLAPLRNGVQVLKLARSDPRATDQCCDMMERQLGQMVRLIDDLMDLSRITRGKVELRKQRVELNDIVQQAIETSRPLVKAGRHELAVDLWQHTMHIDADVTRLGQVLSNLLNNAAKYTEPQGRITLSVERHQNEAVIRVGDTGVGIPADMLPRVFDMFTQVDQSLEKAQGGLGIGLSLVKGLVEMHGGSVEAHSRGRGLGSEFVVRLPLAAGSDGEAQTDATDARPVMADSRRVLVVDDNRDAAMSLAMLLKTMGNEAEMAHDGLEALKVAEEFRPDIVLLDIGMPNLNGYATAKQIRERPWGQKPLLVALTGWGQDEDRQKSKDAGFDKHFVKPMRVADLQKLLSEFAASQK